MSTGEAETAATEPEARAVSRLGSAGDLWARLEGAASQAGAAVVDAASTDSRPPRTLQLGLHQASSAHTFTVGLDRHLTSYCFRLPLGALPGGDTQWATDFAVGQSALHVSRIALSADGLEVASEVATSSEPEALAAYLQLIALDAGTAAAILDSSQAEAGSPPAVAEPQVPESAIQELGQARGNIATALRQASSWGYQVAGEPDSWRLVRQSQAAPGTPATLSLQLNWPILLVSTRVRLPTPLPTETTQALSLFLLQQNGRYTVRARLGAVTAETGPQDVVIERPVLLAGLVPPVVAGAVAVVTAGYQAMHREVVVAACNSCIAAAYTGCCEFRLMSGRRSASHSQEAPHG